MSLFSSATITRFTNQGETEVSVESPFLVDRVSIGLVANTSIYTIPDYVTVIRRVTYKGIKLEPLPQHAFRDSFQSATQKGTPFWYIFENVGQNSIKLFPTPQVNLASVVNVWSTDIPNGLIVEFYRASDNSTFILPNYIRRQMLKQYVAKMTYSIEGQGQNLLMSKYFEKKWAMSKVTFQNLLEDLANRPRKLIVNGSSGNKYFPGNPVLPISRFGISVNEGE